MPGSRHRPLLGLLLLLALIGVGGLVLRPSTSRGPAAEGQPGTAAAAIEPVRASAGSQDSTEQGSWSIEYRPSPEFQASAFVRASDQDPTRPASAAAGTASPVANLKPRQPLPKEPLQRPPGEFHLIEVKFADAVKARPRHDGRLSLYSPDPQPSLQEIIEQHQLRFTRSQTATDEAIQALERRAAEGSGVAQPDLLGVLQAAPSDPGRDGVWEAAQALHALNVVEWVSLDSLDQPPPPPAIDISPTSGLLDHHQTYRTASGIHVDHAWNVWGVKGEGIRVTDCEYWANEDHEDLATLFSPQPNVTGYYENFGFDHGTAVLGVLAAGENAYGMTGCVPGASTHFYPEYSERGAVTQYRTATITAAIADSSVGDVVLLEMQVGGPSPGSNDYVAAEWSSSVWNAVKVGSDAGIIVVGAAGNGGEDLDGALYDAYRARGDSGAILVGAGNTSRARRSYSTYGSRINLQGWGGSVATTGYGGLARYGGDEDQEYTSTFSGTSSASPIVTSAVVLVQSAAKRRLGRPLTPLEMRNLLVSTGKPQTGDTSKPIGPLPDLAAALPQMMLDHDPPKTSLEIFGRYHFDDPDGNPMEDPNGNRLVNLLEYFHGTHPTEDRPGDEARLASIHRSNGGVTFRFQHNLDAGDVSWQVERADAPNAPNEAWTALTHGVDGVLITTDGDEVRVFLPVTSGYGFLRLRVTQGV